MPKMQVFFWKLQGQIHTNLYYFSFCPFGQKKRAQAFARALFSQFFPVSAAAAVAAAATAVTAPGVVAAAAAAEQDDDQDNDPQTTAAIVIPAPHIEYLLQL